MPAIVYAQNDVAADYIVGVVVNSSGSPEAGVWVIAETEALATPYRKIVVTNDNGNFVLPEMPAVEFQVWVRGYGLRDSSAVSAQPGDDIQLTVEQAANAVEAAAIYPASYWLSLLEVPDHDPN